MPVGISKPAPPSAWDSLQLSVTSTPSQLLTYSAADNKVISMPYPLSGNGTPVDPGNLVVHTLNRCFKPPRCYHDSEVCIKVDSVPSSPHNGHIVASCNALRQRCPFLLDITAIVESPSFTTIAKRVYPERVLLPVVEASRAAHMPRRGGLKPIHVIGDNTTQEPLPQPLPVSPELVCYGQHYRQMRPSGGLRSIWQLSDGGVPYADFMTIHMVTRPFLYVEEDFYTLRKIPAPQNRGDGFYRPYDEETHVVLVRYIVPQISGLLLVDEALYWPR
ncbi:hypothetical protein ONZ45_g10700 [Pleurotus djamor]|nr:hypothetical protein ONZ45_g10700 [Pleurotus djamor]